MTIEFDGLPCEGGFYLLVGNAPPSIGIRMDKHITTYHALERAAADLRALATWLEAQAPNFCGTKP